MQRQLSKQFKKVEIKLLRYKLKEKMLLNKTERDNLNSGTISVSDPYSLNPDPDPAKNLNPDPSCVLTLPGITIKLIINDMYGIFFNLQWLGVFKHLSV